MPMCLNPVVSMNTSNRPTVEQAFAVWLTGLPASGKSTITAALVNELTHRGVDVAVLESDSMRKILTPCPTYSEEEREGFYTALTYIGRLLADHGVPVIFDATANRRIYRDRARVGFDRFVEVYIDSPLQVCMGRDPKGIYRQGQKDASAQVPGLQTDYEAPHRPDLVIHGDREAPRDAACHILVELQRRCYLPRD